MKKIKRLLALSLVIILAVSMLPACNKSAKSKKTIRIYCWNDEFKSRFETYYVPNSGIENFEDYKIEWVITPSDEGQYQNKLDSDLPDNEKADMKIDIFLIEADYALKYVNSDYSLDVKSIGITDKDLAQQYEYTKQIVTDNSGALKAVSWQATPGLFAYRRSVAKEVLGTDDPTEVQKFLSSWSKFDEVASKMKDAGYCMVSGYDDTYRTFSNNTAGKWVDDNKNVVIDDNIWKWVEQTKTYTENGYNEKTSLWSPQWTTGQTPAGKVFGYFYSTWGIAFTLKDNSLKTPISDKGKYEVGNGDFGDWACCEGPQAYYWGGTWICAANGTDNEDVVADVMKVLTCNKDVMKKITEEQDDYVNNKAAIAEISKTYKSAFLGGQNHIALLAKAAEKIDMSKTTPYDQLLNEGIQTAFKDYFNGKVTKEKALDNFKAYVKEKYPELNTDNLKVK